jgi:anti-sigma B factor antagonist
MSMKIHTRHVVTILEVSGRISTNEGGPVLHAAVHHALDEGALNLILDLHHLSYVDSTGVGELAAACKAARSRGCEFKLLNLLPNVSDLLFITGLASTLDIYTDEQQAAFTFKS